MFMLLRPRSGRRVSPLETCTAGSSRKRNVSRIQAAHCPIENPTCLPCPGQHRPEPAGRASTPSLVIGPCRRAPTRWACLDLWNKIFSARRPAPSGTCCRNPAIRRATSTHSSHRPRSLTCNADSKHCLRAPRRTRIPSCRADPAACDAGIASAAASSNTCHRTLIIATILPTSVLRQGLAQLFREKIRRPDSTSAERESNYGNACVPFGTKALAQFRITALGVGQRRKRAALEVDHLAHENQVVPARIPVDGAAGESWLRCRPAMACRQAPGASSCR